jgi:hypothetical protein
MTWKPYNGEPFEGERMFMFKSGDVNKFKHSQMLELFDRRIEGIFYLDESESFTKEDMREAFEAGEKNNQFIVSDDFNTCTNGFDEWLKEREGIQ